MNVNKTKICKFKGNHNISWYDFSSERISKDFAKDEQGEIFLNNT